MDRVDAPDLNRLLKDGTLDLPTVAVRMGAAVALPFLESMAPAATTNGAETLSEPPLRMAFMFMPNGVLCTEAYSVFCKNRLPAISVVSKRR